MNRNGLTNEKLLSTTGVIIAIIALLSLIIPPVVWAILGKNDKSYYYLSFGILSLEIPVIIGYIIYSDNLKFKLFRFLSSVPITIIAYMKWIYCDSKTISTFINKGALSGLSINFFVKVICLGVVIYLLLHFIYFYVMQLLKKQA